MNVTRRRLLTQLSVTTGLGVAGGLGLHKLLVADGAPRANTGSPRPTALERTASVPALDSVALAEPMLIHVRDVATGEIALMVGTRELIYRDPELVSRLVRTAASASEGEG